jgi:hypothetical protein
VEGSSRLTERRRLGHHGRDEGPFASMRRLEVEKLS